MAAPAPARLTPDELREATPLLRRLAGDFWLFVTSCCQTLDEHETDPVLSISKPFPRHPHLRDLAARLPRHDRIIVLKSRQMTVSWLLCAWAVWRTLFFNGNRVLFLMIRESDTWKMKARVDHILDHLPDIVSALLDQRVNDNMGEITFAGGSSIVFLPSSPNPGRSMTATDVILDEHAFHPWDLKMYASIKPTLSGGGRVISVSTPNGVGNLFHALWVGAHRDGDGWNGYHPVTIHWRQHPGRDQAWFDQTTRDLPARLVAQEYELDFVQSGAVVFDAAQVRAAHSATAWIADPSDALSPEVAEGIRAARRARPNCPFLIGADVAEGIQGGDFSVATVLHATTGAQVATIGGWWRPDVFAAKLARLAAVFPGVIGVEKNGPGGTVILELERLGLDASLYRHRDWDERGRMRTRRGWETTAKSKPVMVDELEVAIRRGFVRLSDQQTVDELCVYEYKDGSEHSGAPAGYHDDRVIALAIAWQMRKLAGAQTQGVE